jgi:ABC-type transport system involved in cytochrome c biogenesis permease component
MEDVKIILSTLWVATMLTYLLGDVLQLFSGDMVPGEMQGMVLTQQMWLGIAVLMVTPIVMVVLTMTLGNPMNRWANIIMAVFWIGFNLLSLQGYPTFNKFLLTVSMGFNVMTIWYAWKWV